MSKKKPLSEEDAREEKFLQESFVEMVQDSAAGEYPICLGPNEYETMKLFVEAHKLGLNYLPIWSKYRRYQTRQQKLRQLLKENGWKPQPNPEVQMLQRECQAKGMDTDWVFEDYEDDPWTQAYILDCLSDDD